MMFRVSDIKQFVFCPRYVYFTYVQPVPKAPTPTMEHARTLHDEHNAREKRRGFAAYGLGEGSRHYHVPVYAEKLGLRGKIDLVIDAGAPNANGQRYYPVECKDTASGVRNNFKYQLAAYAMALEEVTGTPVHKAFLYIIPEKRAHTVPITEGLRTHIRRMLTMMRTMVEREIFPEPRSRARCFSCEMRRYCNDLDDASGAFEESPAQAKRLVDWF